MESNEILDDSFESGLSISEESRGYIAESAKWGNFLAIIGFIGAGLMVLAGIIMAVSFSAMGSEFGEFGGLGFPPVLIAFFYIGFAILYFFPTLYLYRFSQQSKQALAKDDTHTMTLAFGNLKSMFKFFGIMTIVMIALYGIAFIASLAIGVGGF